MSSSSSTTTTDQHKPLSFVYKTVADSHSEKDVEIALDVYLPKSKHDDKPPRPLIWIHTGGFLQGSRRFLPHHFIRACDRLNLLLVTPDYRLAPQVALHDVLQDVADSIAYTLSGPLADRVAEQTDGRKIDTGAYILAGSSAGGWAALLLGLQLTAIEPKVPTPMAVISIYPITTLSSARAPYFYEPLKPLPFAPSPQAKVGDSVPLTDALRAHMDPEGAVLSEAPIDVLTTRAPLYVYARQEGIYPHLVLGESERADTSCVPSLLTRRYASVADEDGSAPPPSSAAPKFVFLATGDADVHVETDQTDQALKALRDANTPFDVFSHIIPGKGHLYDIHDTQVDIPEIWSKVEAIL